MRDTGQQKQQHNGIEQVHRADAALLKHTLLVTDTQVNKKSVQLFQRDEAKDLLKTKKAGRACFNLVFKPA